MTKLSLKILAEQLAEMSSRLDALESVRSHPSPASPACFVCGKNEALQPAPIPMDGPLSPRITRLVCEDGKCRKS